VPWNTAACQSCPSRPGLSLSTSPRSPPPSTSRCSTPQQPHSLTHPLPVSPASARARQGPNGATPNHSTWVGFRLSTVPAPFEAHSRRLGSSIGWMRVLAVRRGPLGEEGRGPSAWPLRGVFSSWQRQRGVTDPAPRTRRVRGAPGEGGDARASESETQGGSGDDTLVDSRCGQLGGPSASMGS
jgi:hypothetical protein